MLLRMLSVRYGLSSTVLAVDEQFNGAVLMGLHFLHDCFVERVHVELVEHNCRDKWLCRKIKLHVLLQIVQRMLVALNQHQVEALLSQVVSVNTASFGACAINNCSVSLVAHVSNL